MQPHPPLLLLTIDIHLEITFLSIVLSFFAFIVELVWELYWLSLILPTLLIQLELDDWVQSHAILLAEWNRSQTQWMSFKVEVVSICWFKLLNDFRLDFIHDKEEQVFPHASWQQHEFFEQLAIIRHNLVIDVHLYFRWIWDGWFDLPFEVLP